MVGNVHYLYGNLMVHYIPIQLAWVIGVQIQDIMLFCERDRLYMFYN